MPTGYSLQDPRFEQIVRVDCISRNLLEAFLVKFVRVSRTACARFFKLILELDFQNSAIKIKDCIKTKLEVTC